MGNPLVFVHKDNDPPYVDIVTEGRFFTFWYEGEKLRHRKGLASGAPSCYDDVPDKKVLAVVRRQAIAILKKH